MAKPVETVSNKVCDLPGRSTSHEPGSTSSEELVKNNNCIARKFGVSNQPEKLLVEAAQKLEYLGFLIDSVSMKLYMPKEKNERPIARVSESVKDRLDVSSQTGKHHWEDDGSYKSDSASAITIQTLITAEDKGITSQQSELQSHDQAGPTVQDGIDVVGQTNRAVE